MKIKHEYDDAHPDFPKAKLFDAEDSYDGFALIVSDAGTLWEVQLERSHALKGRPWTIVEP